MDEERLNEEITPETSGEPVPAETGTTTEEEILPETTADEFARYYHIFDIGYVGD